MRKKTIIVFFLCFVFLFDAYGELRMFDDIFPNIGGDIKAEIFNSSGYVVSSKKTSGFIINGRNSGLNPQITSTVMKMEPGYLVESISVIPGKPGEITLLDVYNSIRNIRDLKGRLYNSYTRKEAVPLFEDATRIKSEKQTTAIPDPAPAVNIPQTETVYIRLKDINFGNSYYRGEMSLVQNGLCYSLINSKNLSYLFVPVIKEGKFIAQLYFEPIYEGILIYSVAGMDVSDFYASKISINSAISKRLEVIISWAIDGILKKT